MSIEINRTECKQQAREAMAAGVVKPWLITLLYLLMTTGVSFVLDLLPAGMSPFLNIAYWMYSAVVLFGYRLWALWTCRRLEPGLESLMDGFSVAGRVILLEIMILLRMVGWAFLLAIPAGLVVLAVPNLWVYLLLIAGTVLLTEIVCLRYALAPYLLADSPEMGPAVALTRSVWLMKGWCIPLFKLYLSFWPWYLANFGAVILAGALSALLNGLSLTAIGSLDPSLLQGQLALATSGPIAALLMALIPGVVTLFFTPYLEVTMAQFYLARRAHPDQPEDPFTNVNMPPM